MNREDVKIIHISSEPDKDREIRSFNSLSNLGYRYIRIINERYKKYPPTHNVFDGHTEWIKGITKSNPDEFGFTSGHYGAWQGHISAILSSFADNDYSLICECDCIVSVDNNYFKDRVDESINLLENSNFKIVRFESPNHQVNYDARLSENIYLGDMMTLGHCYMIHKRDRDWWLNRIDKVGWHSPDWWLNFAFSKVGEKMPSFRYLDLTMQAGGNSIIDDTYRPDRFK